MTDELRQNYNVTPAVDRNMKVEETPQPRDRITRLKVRHETLTTENEAIERI